MGEGGPAQVGGQGPSQREASYLSRVGPTIRGVPPISGDLPKEGLPPHGGGPLPNRWALLMGG